MATIYMHEWPDSEIEGAYYVHGLPFPGAPQNPPQYCWARIHVIEAWRYAAYATWKKCGPTPCPPAVYDSSDAYGQTPAGRHPSGAHNATGSVSGNVDFGYYLKQWNGSINPGPVYNAQLSGPPGNLDTLREAWFHYYLGKVDLAIGGSPLMKLCACDPRIEPLVDSALGTLGGDSSVMMEGRRICFSDANPANGWAQYHYDHHHIRFVGLDNDQEIADYIRQRFINPLLVERPPYEPVPPPDGEPETPCCCEGGGDAGSEEEGGAEPAPAAA